MLLASILLFLPSSSLSKRIRKDGEPTARAFQVRNLSKSSVDVYWVNLASEDRVHQFTLAPGGTDRLNTHVLHEFEVRELPNNDGQCKGILLNCFTLSKSNHIFVQILIAVFFVSSPCLQARTAPAEIDFSKLVKKKIKVSPIQYL